MPRCVAILLLAIGLGVATHVAAAEMRVPAPTAAFEVAMPAMGMNMTKVESTFGVPVERRAAVGDPPISRWVYDGYTVYFEHQYVIHTVLHGR